MYAFVLEGDAQIAGEALKRRDAVGVSEAGSFSINADTDAEVLLMEVPMEF